MIATLFWGTMVVASEYDDGVACLRRNEFDRAIDHLTKAIEANPSRAVAYAQRGIAYTQQGDFKQAERDFDRALRFGPNHVVLLHRGIMFAKQKKYKSAIENFDAALRASNIFRTPSCSAGWPLFSCGNMTRPPSILTRSSESTSSSLQVTQRGGLCGSPNTITLVLRLTFMKPFALILGMLGRELNWRGFWQPAVKTSFGTAMRLSNKPKPPAS